MQCLCGRNIDIEMTQVVSVQSTCHYSATGSALFCYILHTHHGTSIMTQCKIKLPVVLQIWHTWKCHKSGCRTAANTFRQRYLFIAAWNGQKKAASGSRAFPWWTLSGSPTSGIKHNVWMVRRLILIIIMKIRTIVVMMTRAIFMMGNFYDH